MRYLGIDYGSKKVGLALSDEGGQMAFPYKIIKNDKNFFSELSAIIKKEKVESVVFGHSLDKEGKENKIHEAVEGLILDLTLEFGFPIHLEPELYTTKAAERLQKKNKPVDDSAAALILDAFLIKQKNKKI